jgi:hypothetical protein
MRCRTLVIFLLFFTLLASPARAESRIIVRDTLGEQALELTCLLLHCTVNEGLDGALGTLFLITARLPYFDELVLVTVPTEDAEVICFQAGDLDVE